jgi:murein DD-endopeptidase MepM/ murein hydrolase activator NlpD
LTLAAARAIAYSLVAGLAVATLAAAPAAHPGASAAGAPSDPAGTDATRLPPVIAAASARTDTLVIAGRIDSNLYSTLDSCAASAFPVRGRMKLAWLVADIYEYRVDMTRDLRVGDGLRVLVERTLTPAGGVSVGQVLAATLTVSGDTLSAIRFAHDGAADTASDYFDPHGRSLRAAFLRAPVEFRRISSGFGMRKHPILGIWRQHKGTDYVAAQGTPVRSIGNGVVVFAGQKGGYGNVVDIRHPNGYVTRYGHLSRFAPRTRAGARVAIGETIAYVGMTGLATAPHLHFEVLVNGTQRDPRQALRDRGAGEPVPPADRAAFDSVRDALMTALARDPEHTTVAMR